MTAKKAICLLLTMLLVMPALGCQSVTTPAPVDPDAAQNEPSTPTGGAVSLVASPVYPEAVSYENYDALFAIREQNPVGDPTLSAMDSFAYSTASTVLKGGADNRTLSPVSLYFALAMAASGAGGDTAAQLLSLLGFDSVDALSSECRALYRRLYRDDGMSKLTIANSLWTDADSLSGDFSIRDSYKNTLADKFYASLYAADFSSAETGKAIGKWIADNTNGTLSPTFELSPETVMLLVNTVYFYDEWVDRFNAEATAPDAFHLADGTDVTVDFMNTKFMSHGFARGENFLKSSLSLKQNGSMTFILPNEGVSVSELLSSPESVRAMFELENGSSGEVTFKIPKFDFDSEFSLRDALVSLGVTDAFDDKADFSLISDAPLFISNVHQQTHIAIDENGVEASAFTDIAYAGAAMPTDSAELILDRPFIFAITDSVGGILFIGVCENPA